MALLSSSEPNCVATAPAARSATALGSRPPDPVVGAPHDGQRVALSTALRVQFLTAEASQLEGEIGRLVGAVAPWLLELPAIGPDSAAQVLVSWSQAGRLRSEAAFAVLASVASIPASSGQVTRHRLMGAARLWEAGFRAASG